jgi:hypothetical protein
MVGTLIRSVSNPIRFEKPPYGFAILRRRLELKACADAKEMIHGGDGRISAHPVRIS